MDWQTMKTRLMDKINQIRSDNDGWKIAKQSSEATVWWKPSSDFKGSIYKTEALLNSDVDTVFRYINPVAADSPRNKWDKAIKQRDVLQHIEPNIYVTNTVTHSALGGLISARQFVDMVLIETNDQFSATVAETVEYDKIEPLGDCVRGTNYPSTIMCSRVPESTNKTQLTTYIQTDIGGMVPQSLVDQALPSSQLTFVSVLIQALKDGQHWNSTEN